MSEKPESEVEVNVRLFEPAVLGQFRLRFFDGADTWKYIGESLGSVHGDDEQHQENARANQSAT
jgi:hypothetical protein